MHHLGCLFDAASSMLALLVVFIFQISAPYKNEQNNIDTYAPAYLGTALTQHN